MRESFGLTVDGVRLGGWTSGEGDRVVLLHGGPGMGFEYLDSVTGELADFRVASYQQRGLPPSRTEGPFDVGDHVADYGRLLDGLGWERAVVIGHSWGGHLALHVALALPARVDAALIIDPMGGVGDGGVAEFEAEMEARTPEADRQRAEELDQRVLRGEGGDEDAVEALRLYWPAYFPTREQAPPMPPARLDAASYAGTYASAQSELPRLEAGLPDIRVPVGFVAGSMSPMPTTTSTDTAERIPGAWVDVVEGAGHFVWLDRPGSVRAALDRLLGR